MHIMEGINAVEKTLPEGGYFVTAYYLDFQCLSLEQVVSAAAGDWLLVIVRLF